MKGRLNQSENASRFKINYVNYKANYEEPIKVNIQCIINKCVVCRDWAGLQYVEEMSVVQSHYSCVRWVTTDVKVTQAFLRILGAFLVNYHSTTSQYLPSYLL